MKKLTIKQIKAAYDELSHVFYSHTYNYAQQMLKVCISEERSHRGFRGDFATYHPGAIGVTDCAKMFVVRRVAGYLQGGAMPKGADYLHMQKSCFFAAGMADEFGKEIRAAWKSFDIDALAGLDYCDYVKAQ